MPIPNEVQGLLARIENLSTRRRLHVTLERWEQANRTLTEVMLIGAHRIPLIARVAVHLAHNPLLEPVGEFLWGATVLEAAIRRLAKHYERRGVLTDETRKHFEHLVRELARANRR